MRNAKNIEKYILNSDYLLSIVTNFEPETIDADPDPSFTLKSLRNIGYTLESAIADIIDNSISAYAENIWIDRSGCKYVMISDDGIGLNDSELQQALKIGVIDCDEIRKKSDLGRFGTGMKYASFSQCKKLTLASKTENGNVCAYQWDLDYVARTHKWKIIHVNLLDYPNITDKLNNLKHGTVIYWEMLDRHTSDYDNPTEKEVSDFNENFKHVEKYVEMIFHRFLTKNKISIHFPNNRLAKPWDPFLSSNISVIHLDIDSTMKGIKVMSYVMPHKSKFKSDDEYAEATGPMNVSKNPNNSWDKAQGFYVYRGDRMITYASWLGLRGFTKSRGSNLVRISLDISNKDDELWGLDIMKTSVKIPPIYKDKLNDIAQKARTRAWEVYAYRGKLNRNNTNPSYQSVWSLIEMRNSYKLKINRNHMIINNWMNDKHDSNPEKIIHLIEETVPVNDIVLKKMKNDDIVSDPFTDNENELIELLQIYKITNPNLSHDEMENKLLSIEPFSEKPEIVKKFINGDYK